MSKKKVKKVNVALDISKEFTLDDLASEVSSALVDEQYHHNENLAVKFTEALLGDDDDAWARLGELAAQKAGESFFTKSDKKEYDKLNKEVEKLHDKVHKLEAQLAQAKAKKSSAKKSKPRKASTEFSSAPPLPVTSNSTNGTAEA